MVVFHHQLVTLGEGGRSQVLEPICKPRQYTSGWHNFGLSASQPSRSSEYYRKISSHWKEEFECGLVVDRSGSAGFAHYSDFALANDGKALVISHIAITEYAMIAVLRFLTVAGDGVVGVACLELPMGGMAVEFLFCCRMVFVWRSII